jgi:formylglycine-generating enzyme required for sulfatase activity
MVPIPSLLGTWIDQYESCVEVLVGNNTWEIHPFNYPVDDLDNYNVTYRAAPPLAGDNVSVVKVAPQAYISQAQSEKACKAAGKVLCSLAQYMAACSNNTTYPYGNEYRAGYCNEGHPNPIVTVFGPNATWNLTEMNDPILDTLPHTLVPGGTYAKCTNAVTKTFDMSGNLDEWVADRTAESHGIFKGGYFVDANINGRGCLYETTAHAPTYHDYSLGFRCCYIG